MPPNISAIRYLINRNADVVKHQNSDMRKAEDLTTFGGRLRAARMAKKLNQAQLAKAAGISQPLVSELEGNRYSGTANMVMLAHVTGVRPLWLERGRGPRLASDPEPASNVQATRAPDSERPRAAPPGPTSGFPQRLQILLTETKVTTAALARELQQPHAVVKRWLDGAAEPTAGQIFEIADAHQYSARWLATGIWEVTGKGGVPLRMQLSEEEFRVLQMYRQLPAESREKADIYVRGLVDAMPAAKNVVHLYRPDNGNEPHR